MGIGLTIGLDVGVDIGVAIGGSSEEAVIVAPTPTHQATGAKAEGVGDVTVVWPAHAADDVALLFVESNGSEPAVLGTPAGFTAVTGSPQINDTGGDTTRLTVFWCRATSGAMASPVITDPGNHCEAVIVTYRGCRTFDTPYSAVAGGGNTLGTALTIPSADSGAPNCKVVIAIANGGGWDASGYTNANLSAIAERFDDYTGLGGAGGLSIADGVYAGPGDWGNTAATLGGATIAAYMTIALTGSSGNGSTVVDAALLPLGTPVTAARIWTTGMSDDGKFICQAYNYGSELEPEWFVFDLEAGTYEMFNGPAGIFGNSNYQVSSAQTGISDATGGNQVRAANGRIFFPLRGLNIAYYEPADGEIHHLPTIPDPGNTHAAVFRVQFGNDGLIYATTQADSGTGSKPVVFSIDPATLAIDVLGHVGTLPNDLLYGYYLVAEDGGTHVYVAVGQDPWELWSLNTSTGVATKLDPGLGVLTGIEFNERPEGWTVRFAHGGSSDDYWLADGALYAGAPVHNPGDFAARNVTPDGPYLLTDAPDVNWLEGIVGNLQWRERGSSDPYTEIAFSPTTTSIDLDSLIQLPDDDLFVSASQYNGFARRDNEVFTHLLAQIISQPVYTPTGDYFSGYPNGLLYAYDHTQAWDPGTNPYLVSGTFAGPAGSLSNMKYCYFLRPASNGRIYAAGRLERSGDGSGIAYYATASSTFDGHHDAPLDDYDPRGLLVREASSRVIFSGESLDEVTAAKLLVFDYDLVLQDELVVGVGTNTGLLYAIPGDNNIIVGLNDDTVYRYNVTTETLLSSVEIGEVKASAQHADGRLVVAVDDRLIEINPTTLVQTAHINNLDLAYDITALVWTDAVYLIAGPTVYQMVES